MIKRKKVVRMTNSTGYYRRAASMLLALLFVFTPFLSALAEADDNILSTPAVADEVTSDSGGEPGVFEDVGSDSGDEPADVPDSSDAPAGVEESGDQPQEPNNASDGSADESSGASDASTPPLQGVPSISEDHEEGETLTVAGDEALEEGETLTAEEGEGLEGGEAPEDGEELPDAEEETPEAGEKPSGEELAGEDGESEESDPLLSALLAPLGGELGGIVQTSGYSSLSEGPSLLSIHVDPPGDTAEWLKNALADAIAEAVATGKKVATVVLEEGESYTAGGSITLNSTYKAEIEALLKAEYNSSKTVDFANFTIEIVTGAAKNSAGVYSSWTSDAAVIDGGLTIDATGVNGVKVVLGGVTFGSSGAAEFTNVGTVSYYGTQKDDDVRIVANKVSTVNINTGQGLDDKIALTLSAASDNTDITVNALRDGWTPQGWELGSELGVTVKADQVLRNITINASDFREVGLSASTASLALNKGTLTIKSGKDIVLNNDISSSAAVTLTSNFAGATVSTKRIFSDGAISITANDWDSDIISVGNIDGKSVSIRGGNINITANIASTGGALTLQALGVTGGVSAGDITAVGGALKIVTGDDAASFINTGRITVNNGKTADLISGGSINVNGDINASTATSLTMRAKNGALDVSNSINMLLTGTVSLWANGNLSVGATNSDKITAKDVSLISDTGSVHLGDTTVNLTGAYTLKTSGIYTINAMMQATSYDITVTSGDIVVNSPLTYTTAAGGILKLHAENGDVILNGGATLQASKELSIVTGGTFIIDTAIANSGTLSVVVKNGDIILDRDIASTSGDLILRAENGIVDFTGADSTKTIKVTSAKNLVLQMNGSIEVTQQGIATSQYNVKVNGNLVTTATSKGIEIYSNDGDITMGSNLTATGGNLKLIAGDGHNVNFAGYKLAASAGAVEIRSKDTIIILDNITSAGSIAITSTHGGVDIWQQTLTALTGGVTLNAAGNVSANALTAKTDILLTSSSGSVELNGLIKGVNVGFVALDGRIRLMDALTATGAVKLLMKHSFEMYSNEKATNNIQGGSISITSIDGGIRIGTKLTATSGDIVLMADSGSNQFIDVWTAISAAKGSFIANTSGRFNARSTITALNDVDITARDVNLNDLVKGKDVYVTAYDEGLYVNKGITATGSIWLYGNNNINMNGVISGATGVFARTNLDPDIVGHAAIRASGAITSAKGNVELVTLDRIDIKDVTGVDIALIVENRLRSNSNVQGISTDDPVHTSFWVDGEVNTGALKGTGDVYIRGARVRAGTISGGSVTIEVLQELSATSITATGTAVGSGFIDLSGHGFARTGPGFIGNDELPDPNLRFGGEPGFIFDPNGIYFGQPAHMNIAGALSAKNGIFVWMDSFDGAHLSVEGAITTTSGNIEIIVNGGTNIMGAISAAAGDVRFYANNIDVMGINARTIDLEAWDITVRGALTATGTMAKRAQRDKIWIWDETLQQDIEIEYDYFDNPSIVLNARNGKLNLMETVTAKNIRIYAGEVFARKAITASDTAAVPLLYGISNSGYARIFAERYLDLNAVTATREMMISGGEEWEQIGPDEWRLVFGADMLLNGAITAGTHLSIFTGGFLKAFGALKGATLDVFGRDSTMLYSTVASTKAVTSADERTVAIGSDNLVVLSGAVTSVGTVDVSSRHWEVIAKAAITSSKGGVWINAGGGTLNLNAVSAASNVGIFAHGDMLLNGAVTSGGLLDINNVGSGGMVEIYGALKGANVKIDADYSLMIFSTVTSTNSSLNYVMQWWDEDTGTMQSHENGGIFIHSGHRMILNGALTSIDSVTVGSEYDLLVKAAVTSSGNKVNLWSNGYLETRGAISGKEGLSIESHHNSMLLNAALTSANGFVDLRAQHGIETYAAVSGKMGVLYEGEYVDVRGAVASSVGSVEMIGHDNLVVYGAVSTAAVADIILTGRRLVVWNTVTSKGGIVMDAHDGIDLRKAVTAVNSVNIKTDFLDTQAAITSSAGGIMILARCGANLKGALTSNGTVANGGGITIAWENGELVDGSVVSNSAMTAQYGDIRILAMYNVYVAGALKAGGDIEITSGKLNNGNGRVTLGSSVTAGNGLAVTAVNGGGIEIAGAVQARTVTLLSQTPTDHSYIALLNTVAATGGSIILQAEDDIEILKAMTASGSIIINNTVGYSAPLNKGRLYAASTLTSSSGDIVMNMGREVTIAGAVKALGKITIATIGGDVDVAALTGGAITLESLGGSVFINAAVTTSGTNGITITADGDIFGKGVLTSVGEITLTSTYGSIGRAEQMLQIKGSGPLTALATNGGVFIQGLTALLIKEIVADGSNKVMISTTGATSHILADADVNVAVPHIHGGEITLKSGSKTIGSASVILRVQASSLVIDPLVPATTWIAQMP